MGFKKNTENLTKLQYTKGGVQFHIQCQKGDVGKYVLLPGDPGRVDLFCPLLDQPRIVAHNREHKTLTGYYKNILVSVTSTGMGCPSTAIAVEELGRIGATHFIRIGSSAIMQDHIRSGDLIVASGAHPVEGTTRAYLEGNDPFSCIASYEVVNALVQAAEGLEAVYHVGPVVVHDAFFAETEEFVRRWKKRNTLSVEMESSVLFALATLRGYSAGTVLLASGNLLSDKELQLTPEQAEEGRLRQHRVALEAIRIMEENSQPSGQSQE